MTAADWISDLARHAEAASGGEWTAQHRGSLDWLSQESDDDTHQPGSSVHNGDPGNPLLGTVWPHRNGAADAEFIAAANPATILRLIEEHRALAARLAAVEALADEWERTEAYQCTNAGECPRCLAYQSVVIRLRRAVRSAAPTTTPDLETH